MTTAAKPKISIVSTTYNHEKYIRAALESFIAQDTEHSYEVIIADDCSTDKTPKIIQEYAERYPQIIKPILRKKNLGIVPNFIDTLSRAKGDYIALCEGDDYWTSKDKLQLQVEFLEKNTEFALCFHPVEVVFEEKERKKEIYPKEKTASDFTLERLLKENFIQTNSVMYRRQKYRDIPEDIMPLDWFLHLYHARFGKIGFINKPMSVYRVHAGGVWHDSRHNLEGIWKKYGLQQLGFFIELKKLYGNKPEYKTSIHLSISDMFNRLIVVDQKHNTDLLKKALQRYPEAAEDFISEQRKEIEKIVLMLQAREQDIINQKEDIAFRKREIRRLEDENQYVSKVLHDVLNSTSWKLTEPVRRSMVIGHKGASKAKTAAKMVRDAVDTKQVVKSYNSPDFAIEHVQRAEDIELALIVHLYYTESWPLLKEKLRLIQSKESKSDLFVTLPKHNAAFAKNIKADFPHAYTLIVPNRGRDVLPFLQVSKALKSLGYKYFLKVHSKRSPHRKDGSDWFSDIINSLVPGNTEVIGQILEQLKKEGTGIIGPAGQYISLLVNYEANQSKLHAIVRDTISNAAAEKIKEQKTDYGFMAGTMFWGRFDALAPLLAEKYDAAKFDPERGQIDGTTAHAMERAFCLVPELNRKQILEIDESGLHKVAYKTDNIPDWSDVYIGPKA